MVHPIAARGFIEAERYERGRPEYPADAVDWLVAALGVTPGKPVIDLAAGTGKLTRALMARDLDVIAVEPSRPMYQPLVDTGVPIVEAVAEMLPFADGSVSGIFVGQAFHWFDRSRAATECRRVLAPGGSLALTWNARDRHEPFVDQLWGIMDRVERDAPWRNHEQPTSHQIPGFTVRATASMRWTHHLSRSDLHDRFLSVSHVAVLDREQKAQVVREIDRVIDAFWGAGAELVEVPYRTDTYWLTPLP